MVAVNQPFADIKSVAHSLRQDTIHGPFNENVTIVENALCINGNFYNLAINSTIIYFKMFNLSNSIINDVINRETRESISRGKTGKH